MKKKKTEFSKKLLVQESILVWLITLLFTLLAFFSVYTGNTNELGWTAPVITSAWAAYGVSQAFYYRKAQKENTKDGIKYETVMRELDKETGGAESCEEDNSQFESGK